MSTTSQADDEFGGFAADLASILSTPRSTGLEERIAAERRATRTAKEKARRATRTEQVNFRVAPEHRKVLFALAEKLDVSATDVFIQALMTLAKQHNIEGA